MSPVGLTQNKEIVIAGKQDQLEGCLQQHGYAKDQARKEVDDGHDREVETLEALAGE